MKDLAEILGVFNGSNGDATRALYKKLEALGPAGAVAVNLFRACKVSGRAKQYRGGSKGMAYDTKEWAIGNLCDELSLHDLDGVAWGWGVDRKLQVRGDPHHHVLYVDLPTGQVSFHTGSRGAGPDYAGAWDGERFVAKQRICRWCATLFGLPVPDEPIVPDIEARHRQASALPPAVASHEAEHGGETLDDLFTILDAR